MNPELKDKIGFKSLPNARIGNGIRLGSAMLEAISFKVGLEAHEVV